jgi:hypothetical protein
LSLCVVLRQPTEEELMLRSTALGSIWLLALAAGCGNNVDHASAVKVMNLALTGTVAADGQVVSVDVDASAGKIDVGLTDSSGNGSAQVKGTITHKGTITSTTVDVTFKDWTDPLSHVTLNGSLHEAGSFSSALPLLGDIKLTGALAATGDVVGTVDFDLQATYSLLGLSVKGDVGGQSMNGGIDISIH